MSTRSSRVGTSMAVASMSCVQLGLALAVGLFGTVGPLGAAWLRLAWAGLILLLVVRPRRSRVSRRGLLVGSALGCATAGVTTLFMEAVARIPLGTASALEFLGPLGVAVARSRGRGALAWPASAAVGVVLLTEPWRDLAAGSGADLVGVGFALAAAGCWAAYILLTQAVGDELSGLTGLAVSLPVAGVISTLVVAVADPGLWSHLDARVVLLGLGLAVLLPVVPFTLELLALRRLTTSAFGTLMCLEPAIATLVGLVVLHQVPGLWPAVGVAFVVAAGLGAERHGARAPAPTVAPAAAASPAPVAVEDPRTGAALVADVAPAWSGSSRTGSPPTSSSGSR
ncbi:EamA family transporter [Nocardioides mangrovicus]|uniref:EamA family transporter n=1 Tax=Nocardioides mangrovicus TaxID=2478913 RepID=A0A3L8P1Y4_9ACTN|nr:EamA family transporter [Nocardioides mangrovicus]